jgi:hypothetical protein
LAFPAIFPASATLIEKHEKERKARAGIRNTLRGRQATALDAPGAALAVSVWRVRTRLYVRCHVRPQSATES